MFDKIKNIFKSDKEENNVTPKNAPKEVTVPAHKIGPKSQDDTTTLCDNRGKYSWGYSSKNT